MTENVAKCASSLGRFRSKSPEVNMVIVNQPRNPVMNGKNRLKFPSSKDYCIKIRVLSADKRQGKNQFSISYNLHDCTSGKKRKKKNSKYLLEVSCITRHPVDEDSVFDMPLHMVCLWAPLNAWNFKEFTRDDRGFWFRFFGKSCRFHIKIILKSTSIPDKIIGTVELDVVNQEIISRKTCITAEFQKSSRKTSLYSDNEYIAVMQELQPLQEKCLWEECICIADRALAKLGQGKADYKVCILLEKSKVACHQGKFMNAKSLVKTALEMIPGKNKNKNKAILIGRAYVYLSLAHLYDMAFGSAEECLRIAKKNFSNCMPCEDTGYYYYQEGRILLGFIFKLSAVHRQLISEAKDHMEMAIRHFQQSHNLQGVVLMNKIHSAQMYTAVLLLCAKTGDDFALADQLISSMAENYLLLSCQTKCTFHFAKALLMEQKGDNSEALMNGEVALDLANRSGMLLEEHWVEKFLKELKAQGDHHQEFSLRNRPPACFSLDCQRIYEADDSDNIELACNI